MVRSIQTDPNEIQLEDALKEEGMGMQLVWEETTTTPQEAMEIGAIMAPQEKRKNFDMTQPTMQREGKGAKHQVNGITLFAILEEQMEETPLK